jgi:hypothetical protein
LESGIDRTIFHSRRGHSGDHSSRISIFENVTMISATTWIRSRALALVALAAISTNGAAQGRPPGWSTPNGESMLAYAPDPDDQLGPTVGCTRPGLGIAVRFFTHRSPPGGPRTGAAAGLSRSVQLTLVSDSVTETVTAQGVSLPDRMTVITVYLPIDHPFVAAFAATGELTLTALGET